MYFIPKNIDLIAVGIAFLSLNFASTNLFAG